MLPLFLPVTLLGLYSNNFSDLDQEYQLVLRGLRDTDRAKFNGKKAEIIWLPAVIKVIFSRNAVLLEI